MEKDDLIDNWLAQEASADEREELDRIIRFTETLEVPSLTSKESAWDNFVSKVEEEGQSNEKLLIPERKKSNAWIVWTASVAAALFLGYFTLFNNPAAIVSYEAGVAEIVSQVLPDDSEVTLNASSFIEFDQNNWSSARELTLTGEAFFEVTEGSTFRVNTDVGAVTVLGTSFNVYNRDNQFSVHCFTGKVQVEVNDQNTILTANQSAAIDSSTGRLTVQEFNPQKAATWRTGEFYFDAVELTEVIEELERQFDIQIEVNGSISNRFYTGFFSTESLTEALQLVFVPMGLKTSVSGNIVTVE